MAFSAFQLLYKTLTIDKMDGCGLSNTVHHEHLQRRLRYFSTSYGIAIHSTANSNIIITVVDYHSSLTYECLVCR